MWQAIPSVLHGVTIFGCYFHWAQVVWWKVQEFGLQVACSTDNRTHRYICKLLSLPYLPAEHIHTIFTAFQQKAAMEPLKQLTSYIYNTWLNSPISPVSSWSVFGCYSRINNDVVGWNFRMNNKAKKGQLSFYMLLWLLHDEARTVILQVHLVSDNKLTCKDHIKYCKAQVDIYNIWDDYSNGKKTANQLLKACSWLVYAPTLN